VWIFFSGAGGPRGTLGAAGRRVRRPLGRGVDCPPQVPISIQEIPPWAPKATPESVPCACVLVVYTPSVNVNGPDDAGRVLQAHVAGL